MQNFSTALKAEHIKKKGTGFYILAVILGAISPVIWAIVSYFQNDGAPVHMPYNYYLRFIESCLDPFAGFFFPLLIIIIVSRITQLDHRNGGWQLMETQPVKKASIYFSKFTVLLIANLIAIVSLVVVSFLAGWIMTFINDVPKAATMEFAVGEVLLIMLRLFLAGVFLTAFQYLISVLLPSFIWSLLIGFFLLLLFLFLNAFNVVPDWYPLEVLSKVSTYKKGSDFGYWITYSEIVSILCSSIILYIGFEWYRHKKAGRAFFGNGKRLAMLALVLVAFGSLLVYTLTPKTMEPHSRTVISGEIDSKEEFRNVYVRDVFINDTIAIIPVTDNKFHYVLKQDVPLDKYEIAFDEAMKGIVVFGNNDSLFMSIRKYKDAIEFKNTGTRIAESQYTNATGVPWSDVQYYLQENQFTDKPEVFIETLIGEWKEAMNESNKFTTVDNYAPREDFLAINKKLLTIKYLNYWDEYLKKRAALHPGETTEETAEMKEMKKTVPLNDESLLSNGDYFTYVKSRLIADNKEDLDENTKSLRAIAQLPPGTFKDKMLYWQLNKSLEDASDKKERDSLMALYAYTFKDKRYNNIITANNRKIENLSKGNPAPLFDAMTLDNKQFSLADLKGKYVMIDVWATWCAPCREESPYFEKLAIKYKEEPVQFVALSIDSRIDHWFVDAKTKSKSVLQLHINNYKEFSSNYNIRGIPRFIFIDPEGRFISSKTPRPSEDAFEQLLKNTLGLKEEK